MTGLITSVHFDLAQRESLGRARDLHHEVPPPRIAPVTGDVDGLPETRGPRVVGAERVRAGAGGHRLRGYIRQANVEVV